MKPAVKTARSVRSTTTTTESPSFDILKLRKDLGFKNPNAVKGYYLNKYKSAMSKSGYKWSVQVHIPYMREIDPKASNVVYIGAFETEEEANKFGRQAAELVRKHPERYKKMLRTQNDD